jgi:DNA-directed RNA polymerase subunit omega
MKKEFHSSSIIEDSSKKLDIRLEKVAAKALERVNHDRYKLARAVGLRAKEISNSGETLLKGISKEEIKLYKASDLALYEIAEGLITIEER